MGPLNPFGLMEFEVDWEDILFVADDPDEEVD